jgi:hypothetical protein
MKKSFCPSQRGFIPLVSNVNLKSEVDLANSARSAEIKQNVSGDSDILQRALILDFPESGKSDEPSSGLKSIEIGSCSTKPSLSITSKKSSMNSVSLQGLVNPCPEIKSFTTPRISETGRPRSG